MMATLLFAGLIYTFISRRQQLSAPGHLIILSLLNAGLLISSLTLNAPGISHWAMPLLVLNLTILPLRQGLALSVLLVATVSVSLLVEQPFADALISSSGLMLMLTVVGFYIWGYDYMAQSAQNLSTTDPITGAHNARFLDETLQKKSAEPLPPDTRFLLLASALAMQKKFGICTEKRATKLAKEHNRAPVRNHSNR